MRLIDADELKKKAIIHFYTTNYFSHIMDMIDEAPTVEERQTAKWIKQGHGIGYRCSNCGKIVMADDSNELNFCCNCGAENERRYRE